LRVVIDVVPAGEEPAAAKARADRYAWLAERGYTVVALRAAEIETDMAIALSRIDAALA
jgi:tRNA/rRNA methyltransferase